MHFQSFFPEELYIMKKFSNLKIKIKHMIKTMLGKRDLSPDYLRSIGCKIGNGGSIHGSSITIDVTRPWLIDIGNDVHITRGVSILTHGYDLSVIRNAYHYTVGSSGKVKIGNNVFIGIESTILKGVTIGNNVIIGAGSLVNKDIPDNCVAAGVPAKVIMPLDEYFEKRKNEQLAEAVLLAKDYYNTYKKVPDISVLSAYYFLFAERSREYLDKHNLNYTIHVRDPQKLLDNFCKTEPMFNGYEEFIKYCNLK